MYLFILDFSENNLLTEQIDIASLYDLPVLNKLLIEHQLINFTDLSVDKSFLINFTRKIEFPVFDAVSVEEKNIFKELMLIDNEEKFIVLRNDVYFEINNLNSIITGQNELASIKDKNGLIFCVFGSIGQLKRIYNKNFTIYDVFKQMNYFTSICEDSFNGYVKNLNGIASYKTLLFDILNGKTLYKPPFIAEGVFTEGDVPEGDFSIVPPVYFGKGVQIESGAVVGANTVIYDYSLVSKNTSIKNSVLFENVYISSNCYIDGTVCCDNASVKRNTAVFSGSVIGADALIGEDMTLENNSIVNKKVRFDKFNNYPFRNKKDFPFNSKFQGVTPDKSALLGSAVAVVFKKPKIIVGSDYSPNALSIKLAFLSGLIASGSRCVDVGVTFKSHLFFSLRYCDCDFSVFFSDTGGGTNIEIFNSKNEELTKTDFCNLFDFCNRGNFIFEKSAENEYVRQIKGLKKMYIREITAFSLEDLPYVDEVVCENKILLKILNEILNKCTKKDNRENGISVLMDGSGTNVNIKSRGKIYTQTNLKKLVFFYTKSEQNTKIFESDFYKWLWRYDSVILFMVVLNIIKISGKELGVLIEELPKFYIKTNCINLKSNNSEIAEKISSKFPFNHQKGVFNIKCNDEHVKVLNNSDDGKVKIIASSKCMAVSEELCNFFSEFLA